MPLSVFGVNYTTAPIDIREKLAFAGADLPGALSELIKIPTVAEAAILSTCNRTELYCNIHGSSDSTLGTAGTAEPVAWLRAFRGLERADVTPYVYQLPEDQSVRHIIRVAAGLDSMVLGEPQILGQVKAAYSAAQAAGTAGKLLNRLFQHTFRVAKQIRTDTEIGSSPVSVAFAAVRLAQQVHGNLSELTALLIGAGDTIELAANHLHASNIGKLMIANRSLDRAQALAAQYGADATTLDELPQYLAHADIVVSATASRLPILGKGAIERALKTRKHRPMFMVDLAVPRDIEPEIRSLSDVYLYTVDDLEAIIDDNLASRRVAADQADEIVVYQTNQFLEWLVASDAVSTITALRQRGLEVRDAALVQAKRRLATGADPNEVLDQLASTVVNKLLHEPSVRLRESDPESRAEMLETLHRLFSLNDPTDPDQ